MIARVVRRFIRKHGFALTMLAVVLGIVFLPTLFGRVVSPNDVYLHYDPWASIEQGRAQNPLIHDPPLSYYTLAAMLKRGEAFDWNPYVGGGIPGLGSVASAMLSPFALLPALVLPLSLFYTGMIVCKVVVAFWFAYLWLREERLGKRGAAVGATVIAAAGPYAVWWLWQGTNATALYPALLYICARIVHGKSNRFALLVMLALAFLLSGFPATVAYGGYLALAYLVWGIVRHVTFPWSELRKGLLAAVVALMIAAPLLAPFASFLERTGYLDMRAEASSSIFYPWSHLRSFVQPYWLGDPVTRSWVGDSALGPMNNFVEATVYLGVLTIPLALLGLFMMRVRSRWLFLVTGLLLIGMMFGSGSLSSPFSGLPGLKFSPMVRLRVLLPIPAGILAGCGFAVLQRLVGRRAGALGRVPSLVALLLAADLALFAAWFTPQIPWSRATPPSSDTVAFLQKEPGTFRIAPTFPYLMPNSAQLVGLEDIRAHWGAERAWRDLLRRIDPGSVDVTTVSLLNSLRMNFDDPLLGMLNVRYVIEPPKIDILRYLIQDRTQWVVPPDEPMALGSGDRIEVAVIPDVTCQAFAIPFVPKGVAGADPWLEISGTDGSGVALWTRRYAGEEAKRLLVLHVPNHAGTARVVIESNGFWASLARDLEARPSYGCVRFPLVLARSFGDGRVFENLDAQERFYASWDARYATREEFVADIATDFSSVTTFHGSVPIDVQRLADVASDERRVQIELIDTSTDLKTVDIDAAVPFLLVSSEKVTPELEVRIDGEPARVHTVNSMFAAVAVGEGRHEVVFERRIARGWWPWSFGGLLLLFVGTISDRRRRVAQP